MKKNVVIEVPITSRKHINLPAPCTYCGKQVAEGGTKEWKEFYKLMHWGASRKLGVMQLWETKNADGVAKKGNVTVHAPYCEEHLEGIRLFGTIKAVSIIGLSIAGLIWGVYISGADESNTFLLRLFLIGVFLVMGGSLGLMLAWGINKLLALFNPAYRDFPAIDSGHWGLSVEDTRVDGGEHGVGPVGYSLRLGFFNVESAQRFLAAYPDARVIKGEKLLPTDSRD